MNLNVCYLEVLCISGILTWRCDNCENGWVDSKCLLAEVVGELNVTRMCCVCANERDWELFGQAYVWIHKLEVIWMY